MIRRTLTLCTAIGLLAPTLAACGDQGDDGGDTVTVGTTDHFEVSGEAAPLDPAASYDVGAWNIMRNTFQTLLRLPRSGTQPEPDAARRCSFANERNTQYRCTLRDGLTFSDGSRLDAKDVAYSVNRVQRIDHDAGPSSLFANLDRAEAASGSEVVFHLREPDATFPHKLTTPAAAIVDRGTYPKDRLREGTRVTGSGPYTLDSLDREGKSATFSKNPDYKGSLKVRNDSVELRFFTGSRAMEKALNREEIDLMTRTLSPEQVERLSGADSPDGLKLSEQPGQEIRYLVFNTKKGPGRKKAVRRAVAATVDRGRIVKDAYQRTVEPLYSLVPSGVPGHRSSFFNEYGEPDPAKARRTLEDADIDIPVQLELTYTSDHYGGATAKEFASLKKQLDDSGLFEATTEGATWGEFRDSAMAGKYQAYGFGWYPDFPDPDNFVAPFFEENNFLNSSYASEKIREEIIPETRRETDRADTERQFGAAQDIVAEDVPLLPLWQGKQYIAARDDITGAEWVLNSSSVLHLWELGRGVSG